MTFYSGKFTNTYARPFKPKTKDITFKLNLMQFYHTSQKIVPKLFPFIWIRWRCQGNANEMCRSEHKIYVKENQTRFTLKVCVNLRQTIRDIKYFWKCSRVSHSLITKIKFEKLWTAKYYADLHFSHIQLFWNLCSSQDRLENYFEIWKWYQQL